MDKQPNTTCKICGAKYYHCKDCERINSWRLIACSPECWNEWCDRIEARNKPIQNSPESVIPAEKKEPDHKPKTRKRKVNLDVVTNKEAEV